MQKVQHGFTVIELLAILAIVGLLAAVIIPASIDATVKSQTDKAYKEVTALKAAFEATVNEGQIPSLEASDPGFIGTPVPTSGEENVCAISLTETTTITCKTQGGDPDRFNGNTISLIRNAEGKWSCATSGLDEKYIPEQCS
ncbi:type IV pilus assembly protein PilA [Methylobacillus rhizosphaerae]|uniref:Type IV pilus assembly protein PilA n=1 Tax=Methylobacillus rhizosphaerae TaxID=551994 RepID=A0A238Y4I7_9PROT|nr:pilin [Methylobacillus rhizosphaerae]SNR65701.1 type IV pilus assembly protein PilA [Methylobacillus rhizosphaerae]